MVIYALVSDASIGYLFLGGVCLGLLMALPDGDRRVAGPQNNFSRRGAHTARRARHHMAGVSILMMPVVLLGGIYSGVTTPTEAAPP